MMSYYYEEFDAEKNSDMGFFGFMFFWSISMVFGIIIGMLLLHTFPELFEPFIDYLMKLI